MARYVRLRKRTTLPTKATRGQIRLYAKADETLETVDDEGNRVPVGDGEGGGSGLPVGGDVGDVVTNTAPGEGEWAAPTVGDSVLTKVTVDLSAEDIATLNSVPVQVVAAPGAGKVIVVTSAVFQYKVGVVAFDSASVALYIGDSMQANFGTGPGLDEPDDKVCLNPPVGAASVTDEIADLALTVKADADPGALGDGTARLTVLYWVMDLA